MPRLKNKLKVLRYAGIDNTQVEIAAKTGLTQATVSKVMNDEEFKVMRNEQKKTMVARINEVASNNLEELDQTRAKSKGEAAVSFGILIDKARALAGEDLKGNTYNIGDNRSLNFNVSTNLGKVVEKNKQ